MKKTAAIIVFSCISLLVSAQRNKICGLVVDKDTETPIGNTMILVSNDTFFTDRNGCFEIPAEHLNKSDTMSFHSDLYDVFETPVGKLKRRKNTIKLSVGAFNLNNVTIQDYTKSKALIEEVVKRIPTNYSTDTTMAAVYFRKYDIIDNDICCFAEGVENRIHGGYAKHGKTYSNPTLCFQTLKYALPVYDTSKYMRLITVDENVDFRMVQKNGNPVVAGFDVLELLTANFFSKLRLEKFQKDDKAFYSIGFSFDYMQSSGYLNLLINKENLAIEKFVMEGYLSEKSMKQYRLLVKSFRKYSGGSMKITFYADYKKINQKYFLSNSGIDFEQKISYKDKIVKKHNIPQNITVISKQQVVLLRNTENIDVKKINAMPNFTNWEQVTPYDPSWKCKLNIPELDPDTKTALLKKGIAY